MPVSKRARLATGALLGLATTLACAGGVSPVFPWTVGPGIDCEFTTVQAALDAAAALPGAQTIAVSRLAATGNLALLVDDANAVTLEGGYASCSAGRDNTPTALVGNGAQPVLRTVGAGDITLRNLDIGGGRGEAIAGGATGGGAVWHAGSGALLVDDSTLRNNVGGVHVEGQGALVVRGSALADLQGMALSADTGGDVTVEDSAIGDVAGGVAIERAAHFRLLHSSVVDAGTGLLLDGPGSTTLQDATIADNLGAAIVFRGTGPLALDDVQLHDNGQLASDCNAIGYAGLFAIGGKGAITITDSSIRNNCGGVHMQHGTELSLARTVIAGNRASSGGNGGGGGLQINGDDTGPRSVVRFGADVIIENNAAGIGMDHGVLELDAAPGYAIRNNAGTGIALSRSIARIGSGAEGGGIRGNVSSTGGGLFISGGSHVTVYTTDPERPAALVDNVAQHGSGGALFIDTDGATSSVFLFDVQLIGNTAPRGGALSIVSSTVPGSAFCMGRAIEPDSCSDLGGTLPASARSCADPTACNVIRDNHADDVGSAVWRTAAHYHPMPVRFAGTRFIGNTGRSLVTSEPSVPTLVAPTGLFEIRDSVVAGNSATDALFDTDSGLPALPPGSLSEFGPLAVDRSTIAGNTIGAGRVLATTQALRLHESIVHQPGKAVHAGAAADIDARSVIVANDSGLPVRADIVLADPLLTDAANGDVRPLPGSPALDFSSLGTGGHDVDGIARGQDAPGAPTRFGLRDVGAHERGVALLFRDGFE